MHILKRIKNIEDTLDNDTRFLRLIYLIQTEPNSTEYIASDTCNSTKKTYKVNDLREFYKNNNDKNTHIIKIDVVDNTHLEKYLYEMEG